MKSLVCFVLTALLLVLSGVLTYRLVKFLAAADSDLARLEAPGSVVFTVEEEKNLTIWHDYQTIYKGTTVSNESTLPSGFSFELKAVGSSHSIPFIGSGMTSTMQSGNTSKSGVGSFEVPGPGDYELSVSAPPGEPRIISVSEGSMVEAIGSIFGYILGTMISGLAGVVTLILGFVFLFTGKKKPASPPPLHVA